MPQQWWSGSEGLGDSQRVSGFLSTLECWKSWSLTWAKHGSSSSSSSITITTAYPHHRHLYFCDWHIYQLEAKTGRQATLLFSPLVFFISRLLLVGAAHSGTEFVHECLRVFILSSINPSGEKKTPPELLRDILLSWFQIPSSLQSRITI